ncbi:ABC transporter substrate-binding protein [Curvibacter sp. HBC61]|uniref:ABC transporter substrate-binding protein n=1 Tax=Curvibacter cyanobacteriorum TaxID=3026422 RepID=A0ABT5N5B8_9BURK|nr:ABC transporter substrate-binding protein [Curvibacter sp. HBC61]MDD0840278.1 ABC transporter substrate-binding protein [Curvibacter sp. HBC61]
MLGRRHFLRQAPRLAAWAAVPAWIGSAQAQEGVSNKAITIGSTAALSGPLGALGQDLKLGIDAAMAQINARGGVGGRSLQLQMQDDAYVPARSVENVRKMVGDGSVLALLSCMGTPNNTALLPLLEEHNLPYVAPLTGASSLRRPGNRPIFHVRASYTDETQRLIQRLASMGMKQLAIVYLDNGFGREVLADALKFMAAQGLEALAQVPLDTGGKNLPEVVNQVLAARPGAVFMATAGVVSQSLVTGLRKQSPSLPLAGLSVALSQDSVKALGPLGSGVALTMVFPDPNRAKTPVVREYQSAMRALGQSEFSQGSLEGYINTRVLAEGLERSGKDPSRARLRSALATLRGLDLGGFVVDYGSSPPYVGSHFVELGILGSNGRFVG